MPRPRAYAGGMLWLTPGIEIEDVREQAPVNAFIGAIFAAF